MNVNPRRDSLEALRHRPHQVFSDGDRIGIVRRANTKEINGSGLGGENTRVIEVFTIVFVDGQAELRSVEVSPPYRAI